MVPLSEAPISRYNSAGRLLMRGYFRWQVVRFSITGRTLPTNPVSRFISAEAATRAASCVCTAPLTKDAPGSVSTAREKAKAVSHLDLAVEANPIRELVV